MGSLRTVGVRALATGIRLGDSVQFVRGVGPTRTNAFATLGVSTLGDLIEYFPFRHELRPKSQAIGSLELGVVATVVGELRRVRTGGGGGRETVTADLVDGTGQCRVRWFHSPFLTDKLHYGQTVRITGKVDLCGDLASFTNPKLTVIDDQADPLDGDSDQYVPVYSGTSLLPSQQIAAIIAGVLEHVVYAVVDFVPESVRRRRQLPPFFF